MPALTPEFDASAHGSLGALAPSWWEPAEGEEAEPWLDLETAYQRFLEWVEARGIEPWAHQEEALFALAAGSNVILGTPTGSGKSLVAIGMMFMAMATGQRGYYTAPIKALVSEKFFYLVDIFGRDNVGMITGDSHINTGAPIICCTAEILANQALREGEDTDIGVVAMDEFHFFSDPDRGWAWQVPLLTLPHTQFMLMSATLGDTTAIADALERHTGRDVEVIADAPRPIPLSYEYVKTGLEGTVELALRQGDSPLYIVHFSQDEALKNARALASYGVKLTLNDGVVLNAEVTRQGGKMLWMVPEHAAFEPGWTLEECAEAARDFLLDRGYGEMEANHYQVYDGLAVINFVAVQDGVLLYPDLVKVQVRMDTGEVVGLEANNYLMNHTERTGLSPALSGEQALEKASSRLEAGQARLCVIPYREGERLCYEVPGRYEGREYRVYIDAITGEEAEVLMMVDSVGGRMAA